MIFRELLRKTCSSSLELDDESIAETGDFDMNGAIGLKYSHRNTRGFDTYLGQKLKTALIPIVEFLSFRKRDITENKFLMQKYI